MLEWQLKNAPKLKHLPALQKRKEAGEDIPFLRNVPEVLPIYYWIWEGFAILAQQRMFGHEGAPQPIQVSEIAAYCKFAEITDELDKEDFLRSIIMLDELTLNFANDERARAQKKQQREARRKGGGGSSRRR